MEIPNEFDGMPDFEKFFKYKDLEDEAGEEWKNIPKRKAAKDLYEQAWKVYNYSRIFCESLKGEHSEMNSSLILQNATILCPKIVGAEGGDNYMIRMENASIIRTNAIELRTQVKACALFDESSEDLVAVIVDEIEVLKEKFKLWISYFEKDDIEDDWGLY